MVRQLLPEPAEIGGGLPEHVAQCAAAVVAALEHALGARSRNRRNGATAACGSDAASCQLSSTQRVQLAGQRAHLVDSTKPASDGWCRGASDLAPVARTVGLGQRQTQ